MTSSVHKPPERVSPARVPEAEEHDAPELTRIRRGYWKNHYRALRRVTFNDAPPAGPGEYFAEAKAPSREIAEEWAAYVMSHTGWVIRGGVEYLGPVFFPEDKP